MKKFKKGDKVKMHYESEADPEALYGEIVHGEPKFLYGEIVHCEPEVDYSSYNYYKIKLNDGYFPREIFIREDIIELVDKEEEQPLVCAAIDFLGDNFASLPAIEKDCLGDK